MALGRGLGEILSEVGEAYEKDLGDMEAFRSAGAQVEEIEVDAIVPNPYQPRKHFDEKALEELSASIKRHGLLQPIVVVPAASGYILVAGERRWRAHKMAQLSRIKAIVADVQMDELRMRELALVENIQREDLNAIELAKSYAELIEVHKITHEALASIVHKSRSQITNTLRLLTLGEYAQQAIAEGKLTQGHAKVLVGLGAHEQKIVVDSIVGQKLSVRDAEKLAKRYKEKAQGRAKQKRQSALTDAYTEALSSLPFSLSVKSKSVEIRFRSTQEIEKFLSYFKN